MPLMKFKLLLAFKGSIRAVLLPDTTTYANLVDYIKKKFAIQDQKTLSLYYTIREDTIDIKDDADVYCMSTEILQSKDSAKLFINQSDANKVTVLNSVPSDLHESTVCAELCSSHLGWQRDTLNTMPSPANPSDIQIKGTTNHIFDCTLPIKIGDRFDNKAVCVYVMGKKAFTDGYEYKVLRSCVKRYSVCCAQVDCKWVINTRKLKGSPAFRVTSLNNIHNCPKTSVFPNHRNATRNNLGPLLIDKFRDSKRVYNANDIVKDLHLDWKLNVSYYRAWAGKQKALELLHDTPDDSYTQFPYYCYNLKLLNPGTVTHIDADEEGHFEKCFIAFGVAIRSFLRYMRPLIKIDGAHLKDKYRGTNLLAVGMDGNNQIVPIATGETIDTWSWFLTKLKESLGDIPNLVIISDRHQAIMTACSNVFLGAFHGICCRHLLMNCNLKPRKFNAIYWKTCKAYLPQDFERHISDIRVCKPEAYRKLQEAGFEYWSRAYFPTNRYNYLTSNSVESINPLSKGVRKYPITKLMDFFRDLLQRRYCDRRSQDEVEPPADELTTWASSKVIKRNMKSANWLVHPIHNFKLYHVRDHRVAHRVDLENGKCTCRKWQLSGIPCGHVCAVSRFIGLRNPNRWAKAWFSKRTLNGTYKELVYPLLDVSMWEKPLDLPKLKPPISVKRQPGRPKSNACIRSQCEEPRVDICSRCEVSGHSRDACHAPLRKRQNTMGEEASYGFSTFYSVGESSSHSEIHLDDF